MLRECLPGWQVIGEGNLLREPEVVYQAVPDCDVGIILDPVPVDGLDLASQW
jgi:hypothetical protein